MNPRVEGSASHDTENTANNGEITDDDADLSLEKESQFDNLNSNLGLDEVDCNAIKHQNNFNEIFFLLSIICTFIGRVGSSKLQARSVPNQSNILSNNFNSIGAFNDVYILMILQWISGQLTLRMPLLLPIFSAWTKGLMPRTMAPTPTERLADLPMFIETRDSRPP